MCNGELRSRQPCLHRAKIGIDTPVQSIGAFAVTTGIIRIGRWSKSMYVIVASIPLIPAAIILRYAVFACARRPLSGRLPRPNRSDWSARSGVRDGLLKTTSLVIPNAAALRTGKTARPATTSGCMIPARMARHTITRLFSAHSKRAGPSRRLDPTSSAITLFVGDGKPQNLQQGNKQSRRLTGFGLWVYDKRSAPIKAGGNAYYAVPGVKRRPFFWVCSLAVRSGP